MTPAFRQGFMDKLAAIKSPEDLDAFYKKLKYRVLNEDTNRPYFNTNFETFENWHLLSPEQIKKHKIGICYDTAAMTDKVLNDLGVEHRNYFARSDKADGWENDPTHAFNVYKDENGDWRWLEGSWEPYKGNNWKERHRKDLVKKIVKALAEASGKKQKLHEVAEFPGPGIAMKDWEAEMLKNPVKKAESYSLKKNPTYEDALKVFDKLDFDDRANLVPRHPDFLRKVPDDMLFDRQVVVDGKGDPVGFQEFYSRKDKIGRRLSPHNIIAVSPEARGNGLAKIMVEAAIRKARKEKVKRLLWEAFADNEPSIRAAMSAGFEDVTPKNAKGYRKLVYNVSEKKASSLDIKKLFPNSKFPTEDELKEKEKSFSVGDHVKVSDHIRCRQKGHVGTIVRIDPENKHGWKSFIVEFDDKKYGSMGFSSGNIDKVVEKNAQAITPEEIEAMARPHYADSGSHGWNHIQDVLASARRMRRKELLKKELAALMYHDSSLLTGPRETHAEDSADIAKKELAGKFSRRQLADIVNAIAHHRASYDGNRKSKLENLVAAADRDVFVDGNIDDYILRSYRYGLEHGMTPDEAVDNTLHHMPDKYGTNGYAYANVPKIYMDTYGDDVRKAQKAFDSLTADRIRKISKNASSKNETYESGEGEVESYTPDKTEGHDEIVLRLKNGKKIVISNNTRIGIRVIPAEGDHVGYNGYRINGTNVVHKVHGNRHQRGGWLEHSSGF